jgi:hypothetical protein
MNALSSICLTYRIGDTESNSSFRRCHGNDPSVAVRTNVYPSVIMKTTAPLCRKRLATLLSRRLFRSRYLCNGLTCHNSITYEGFCMANYNGFWTGLDLLALLRVLQLQSIITAHNQWLPKTRSIPYWTMSVFSSAWLTWFWFTSRLLLHFGCQLLRNPHLIESLNSTTNEIRLTQSSLYSRL